MGWFDLLRGVMGWWSNVTVTPIARVSDGWDAPASRLEYDARFPLMAYTAPRSLLHYDSPTSLPHFIAPRSRLEYEADE